MYKPKSFDVFLALIVLSSIFTYILQSLAWPLAPGRDFSSYITYFVQIFMDDPGYPRIMLHRTFLFPIILGGLNAIGGVNFAEFFVGLMFVGSVVTVYYIGLKFNKVSGVLAALLVMFFSSYGALFHFISSDFFSSCIFLYWVAYLIYSNTEYSLKNFVIHGLFVSILICIKPANQIFILFAFYPLIMTNLSLIKKIKFSALFVLIVFSTIFLISSYNFFRYEHFSVSGLGGGLPFNKVYNGGLVKPGNGDISKEMATLVKEKLLDKDPYSRENIDVDTFFNSPSGRKWFDMVILSERYSFSSEKPLQSMAIEAICQYPFSYIKLCVRDVLNMFLAAHKQFKPDAQKKNEKFNPDNAYTIQRDMESRLLNYNGDDIAVSYFELEMYRDEKSLTKITDLHQRVKQFDFVVPSRDGDVTISRLLNYITDFYPGMLWFLLAGFIGVLLDKSKSMVPLFCMVFLGLVSTVFAVCTVNDVIQYRLVFDPVFIVFGVVGFIRSCRW